MTDAIADQSERSAAPSPVAEGDVAPATSSDTAPLDGATQTKTFSAWIELIYKKFNF